MPSTARRLAEAFWPGPLSICIRANKETVSERARAGLDTVRALVPSLSSSCGAVELRDLTGASRWL